MLLGSMTAYCSSCQFKVSQIPHVEGHFCLIYDTIKTVHTLCSWWKASPCALRCACAVLAKYFLHRQKAECCNVTSTLRTVTAAEHHNVRYKNQVNGLVWPHDRFSLVCNGNRLQHCHLSLFLHTFVCWIMAYCFHQRSITITTVTVTPTSAQKYHKRKI